MPNAHREHALVALALPQLGPFRQRPRAVRPQVDPDHPGHTFDFAGTRPDGRPVAIEVTETDHEAMRADAAVMEKQAAVDEITMLLRQHEVGPGTYALSTSPQSPRLSELHDAIIDEALDLDDGMTVEVLRHADAFLTWFGRTDGIVEFVWSSRAGGELVAEHREMFRAALVRKRDRIEAAGADGYETVLLIEPPWLGVPEEMDFDATPTCNGRGWLRSTGSSTKWGSARTRSRSCSSASPTAMSRESAVSPRKVRGMSVYRQHSPTVFVQVTMHARRDGAGSETARAVRGLLGATGSCTPLTCGRPPACGCHAASSDARPAQNIGVARGTTLKWARTSSRGQLAIER
jgi:hypothetical protein